MADDPGRAPIIDVMLRRDQDLLRSVHRTDSAIEQWTLYLDNSGSAIEEATRRALDVLYGEWDFSSYLGRGGLYIPIPDEFTDEWERYTKAAHEWHRSYSRRRKKYTNEQLESMWRSKPKTKADIMDITNELRFSIE